MGTTVRFTIPGDVPSKKNSKRLIMRGARRFLVPSQKHEDWHREASWLVKKYRPRAPLNYIKIELWFWPSSKRKADLTNKAESVMDLLVDSGFIVDDNWFACPEISLRRVAVDPANPRVEVLIKPFTA
jgi:Holliday junction resolvase RusA-like endonuclease